MANSVYPVKRGRPRLVQPPRIYFIKLRLYPGQDDDLIAFLAGVPYRLRTAAVKGALRTGNLKVRLDGLPDDEQMADALSGLMV
jgi:hypothetical protein